MDDHDSIDIRGKEFQEILGEPPSWLLRWGISAIFVTFIALFIVGYYLEYPETVAGAVRLETSNPPVDVGAPEEGNLIDFFPEDTLVEKGDILARIDDNSGSYTDILALSERLSNYTKDSNVLPNLTAFEGSNIGLIEKELLQYMQVFRGNGVSSNLLKNQTESIFNRNIQNLNSEIVDLEGRIAAINNKLLEIPDRRKNLKAAFEKNNAQTKNQLKKDSLNSGYQAVIMQLITDESTHREEIKRLEGDIERIKREISDRQLEKSNYQTGLEGNMVTRRQDLEISFVNLKNEVEKWKRNHLIIAPETGTLVYQDKLQSKKYYVTKGDNIFAIIPPGAQDSIEGKILLPSKASIKVKVNQEVKIQFNAYRPSEYGLLTGKVVDKATIPKDGQYLVTVSLPDRMNTSKGKTIPFEHEMQGEAKIITADRRFTDLVFEEFMGMLKR